MPAGASTQPPAWQVWPTLHSESFTQAGASGVHTRSRHVSPLAHCVEAVHTYTQRFAEPTHLKRGEVPAQSSGMHHARRAELDSHCPLPSVHRWPSPQAEPEVREAPPPPPPSVPPAGPPSFRTTLPPSEPPGAPPSDAAVPPSVEV